MTNSRLAHACLSASILVATFAHVRQAQAVAFTNEQSALIVATADQICTFAKSRKEKGNILEIKGEVSAELSRLAKVLSEAGFSGAVTFKDSDIEEFVKESTQEERGCKERVFIRMFDQLASEAPRVEFKRDGFYYYTEKNEPKKTV